MAFDTTANILIVGAGPIGLETALYARYLGYPVTVIEQGEVCQHVRQWKHIKMFSPFGDNSSTLGRAAILSQSPSHCFDPLESTQTGQRWLENYLQPLANTDLLQDSLQCGTRVISVSRSWQRKADLMSVESRQQDPFRIIIDDGTTEEVLTASVVIDTSGVLGQPNPIGGGGALAVGEAKCHNQFQRMSPTEEQAQALNHQRVLVVGAGHTAAHTVTTLAQSGNCQITWLTRSNSPTPVVSVDNDPLSTRRELVQAANQLAAGASVQSLPAAFIDRITQQPDNSFQVDYIQQTAHADFGVTSTINVDKIFAHTGFQPDSSIFRELHVHQCYASEGPIQLAAKLLKHSSADCLNPIEPSNTDLINPEPDFYILGIKSYGRSPNFLFRNGLQQIVNLFQIIGDRESLNLYNTFQ